MISHVAPADSTIRDIYNATLKPLWNQTALPQDVRLWDCTLHPPRDITSLLTQFAETTGPNSKTLYDAGWFPSGTWQVLPNNVQPKQSQNYDDVQYNLQDQPTLQSSLPVKLLGHDETIMPSQVLQSVTERFPAVDREGELKQALQVRRQRRQERQAKEAARHARLEERIQALSSNQGNKSNVSLQVKRMLIKSRCTGSSSLKMHDRVYLYIIVIQEGNDNVDASRQEYRYFSQQDTVARILASVVKTCLPREAELLIRRQSTRTNGEENVTIYRKLPLTMRLYEAIAEKFIEPVDNVVIRCFTPPNEEPTTCITENVEEEDERSESEIKVSNDDSVGVQGKAVVETAVSSEATEMETESNETSLDQSIANRMNEAIAAMDEAASQKSKKKASTTSEKVRTMLMKSKAKGDKKRTPKMDDRFFLELVVIEDYSGTSCSASVAPVFLAKSDAVKRILRDCVSIPDECTGTIYSISKESNGGFCEVSGDLSLQDAEAKGFIQSFNRVVVRIYK